MNLVEVCLSPLLLANFSLSNKTVVVVDILRATSVITTALAEGMTAIYPVETVEEAHRLQQRRPTALLGGERHSRRIADFDLDNSPLAYHGLAGREVIFTTTNGTRALWMSKDAEEVIIGSFLNLGAVARYLSRSPRPVLIFCAGRKNHVNIEDTLFAGALVERLSETHAPANDAARIARDFYRLHRTHLEGALREAAHARRLMEQSYAKDIQYVAQVDQYDVVPRFADGRIVLSSDAG